MHTEVKLVLFDMLITQIEISTDSSRFIFAFTYSKMNDMDSEFFFTLYG